MFEPLQPAPADPILGLTDAFNKETHPQKLNLGVGIYKDAQGKTPTLRAVREAETRLLALDAPKTYLPIPGDPAFCQAVQQLLFGAGSATLTSQRAVTAHTPGGTGALAVGFTFVATHAPGATVWLSDPSWENHAAIVAAAGLKQATYGYFSQEKNGVDFDRLVESLKGAASGDVVLLHGCCHNPTGADLTLEQWSVVADLLQARGLIPFIDLAYQGFGEGLEEDAAAVRLLAERCPEVFIASSYSKNFGLYNERVGAITLVAANSAQANLAAGHLKRTIRTIYSNPPRHGGAIVSTILGDAALTSLWQEELAAMRQRIHQVRGELVAGLARAGAPRDFAFIQAQRGMFSYSGLSKEQVLKLRGEYGIYAVDTGRINVAGITADRLAYLCEAVATVLKGS